MDIPTESEQQWINECIPSSFLTHAEHLTVLVGNDRQFADDFR